MQQSALPLSLSKYSSSSLLKGSDISRPALGATKAAPPRRHAQEQREITRPRVLSNNTSFAQCLAARYNSRPFERARNTPDSWLNYNAAATVHTIYKATPLRGGGPPDGFSRAREGSVNLYKRARQFESECHRGESSSPRAYICIYSIVAGCVLQLLLFIGAWQSARITSSKLRCRRGEKKSGDGERGKFWSWVVRWMADLSSARGRADAILDGFHARPRVRVSRARARQRYNLFN